MPPSSSDLAAPRPSRRRWPWVAAGVVVVLVLAGIGGFAVRTHQQQVDDDAARALAVRVARAVSAGDVSGLPVVGGSAALATQQTAALKALGTASAQATLSSERRSGDRATASISVARTLPGGVVWRYDLPVTLVKTGQWQVPADARLVHPDVAPGEVLRLKRDQPARANIVGADGKVIVGPGDVVDVGIQPSRVKGSVGSLTDKVAGLVGVDAAALAKRVQAAPKDAFVDVITLRRSDYDAVRDKLRPLPGVVFRERQQPLAPTREFARALLGTVGPVTADIVTASKGRYVPGDVAGLSGLQRQYDDQLAGTAGVTVSVVKASTSTDAASGPDDGRRLFSRAATPGTPLKITLDTAVQKAADAALQSLPADAPPSALVAVDVRTGQVLAVANSPATGLDRAVVGRYPPGSTFKVVTTLSLLQQGLKPSDPVLCPPTATVGGRTFKNYESEELGSVPFRVDFAKSCNTAFVGLSKRLEDDDLATTAKMLGIGATWDLGTDAFTGSVPVNTSDVDKAAAAFGQGRTEVSPLAVTVATASVARGSYLPPSLVLKDGATAPEATKLPAAATSTLQSLMRDVVTSGTGTALAHSPGGPVHAKTGTAEFGNDVPPKTRAWITGWQGDIAFTAFVEEGKSGGTVAGPVADRFLTLLARSGR